jgi:hypothetical protein
MSDPRDAYDDALAALEAAAKKLEAVSKFIVEAGQVFRDWETVGISNFKGASLPFGVKKTVDGSRWPTADQLYQFIQAYHDAKQAVQIAWNAVPAERRKSLLPPPK